MKQCPRCENEQLKEEYKHCPICGLRLEMNREQVIEQLKDLVQDRESFCVGYHDVVYELDIQALEYAIEELEKNSEEELVKKILNLDRETTSRIAPLTRVIIGYATRKEISLDELEIAFKIAKENYILIHNNKNES